MNKGQTKTLTREIMPKFDASENVPQNPYVIRRDQRLWDRTKKPCEDRAYKNLYFSNGNGRTSENNQARDKAINLCKGCPVRQQCFEEGILYGSVGTILGGVPGSKIQQISDTLGSANRRYIANLAPDHPDRELFYKAAGMLLLAIDGEITPAQALAS